MKNVFTILLASFILLSGMHLSIAKHICGGELTDVKFSFSETASTCGMETEQTACGVHEEATSNCCHNEITKLEVEPYFGATSQHIKEVTQPLISLLFLPFIQSIYSLDSNIQVYTAANDNIDRIVKEVSLPKICVFRI